MKTKKMVYSGLLVAIGVLLPQVFHLLGGAAAGRVFLPMHLPVLLAGCLLGPLPGAVVGILTPVLSFLISGMPQVSNLFFMIFELAAYGFFSGLLIQKKLPLLISLVLSMLAGRLVNALCLMFAGWVLHLPVQGPIYVWTALVTGLPGIALQLIVVPLLVYSLKKVVKINE